MLFAMVLQRAFTEKRESTLSRHTSAIAIFDIF
jgi:hypothetical protein